MSGNFKKAGDEVQYYKICYIFCIYALKINFSEMNKPKINISL